jgi:hypothetical protein
MSETTCFHTRLATGILGCEIGRPREPGFGYPTRLLLQICEDCGHVQMNIDPHRLLVEWLKEKHVATS